jgi:hypothetical protein
VGLRVANLGGFGGISYPTLALHGQCHEVDLERVVFFCEKIWSELFDRVATTTSRSQQI